MLFKRISIPDVRLGLLRFWMLKSPLNLWPDFFLHTDCRSFIMPVHSFSTLCLHFSKFTYFTTLASHNSRTVFSCNQLSQSLTLCICGSLKIL